MVGMVGAIDYGPFAYLGLMAVRPDRQGQRLGRKLMAALLAALDGRGTGCVLLDASPAGAPLYERSGFTDAGLSLEFAAEHGDLAGGPPPLGVDGDSTLRIAVATPGDLDDIANLDGELLGAPRERLWRWLVATYPERTLAAREPGGALVGYLCVQDPLLGPFGARAPRIADTLLDEALRRLGHRNVRLQVPEENTDARAVLVRSGFRVIRSLRHMRRGPCPALSGWRAIYGKGSYCLG